MAASGAPAGDPGDSPSPTPVAEPVTLELPVAVTAVEESNTLAVPLRAIASVPVEDVRFEFDSSFLLPDATRALERVAPLHQRFPAAPLTVSGDAGRVFAVHRHWHRVDLNATER